MPNNINAGGIIDLPGRAERHTAICMELKSGSCSLRRNHDYKPRRIIFLLGRYKYSMYVSGTVLARNALLANTPRRTHPYTLPVAQPARQ